MREPVKPAGAQNLRDMAVVCDGLGPVLARYGASAENWESQAAELRALANVLDTLTPEVVAALRAFVASAESGMYPARDETVSRAARAGLAALDRLSPPRPAAPAGAP